MGLRGPKPKPFWSQVQTSDGCWEWIGTRFANGYGRATVKRESVGAHRLAYELTWGAVPAGLVVRHKCDNKVCVRPDHLEVGTAADNARDRVERGRSLAGDLNPNARLTAVVVQRIRDRYRQGGVTQKQLADEIGVAEVTIWTVVNDRSWRSA